MPCESLLLYTRLDTIFYVGGKKLSCPDSAQEASSGSRRNRVRLPAVESPMHDPSFLKAIIDGHPSPVFVVDASTRELVLANLAAGNFEPGRSCNAILYNPCVGSPPSNRCLLGEALRTQDTVEGTHKICCEDGSIRTKKVRCVPVFDDSGAITHLIHYLTDLPCQEPQDSEPPGSGTLSELREEKERAQLYLDIASVVLVSLDVHGRISLLNRKGGELLACDPRQAIGMDWFGTFVPEPERETVRRAFARLVAGDVHFESYENPIISLDGREKLIEWRNVLLTDEAGRIMGTLSSGQDVTERRAAERALMESEKRFRELADQLPQTVFEADVDGRLTFANSHAFESYGYSQDDLARGINVFDLIIPADRERARDVVASIVFRGGLSSGSEYSARRKDGTTLPVVIYTAPIVRDGETVGMRGIVMDISERKRLEEETLRREKMESVGLLAGGFAHDFNNLLVPVLSGSTLAHHIVQSSTLPSSEKGELLKLLNDMEAASVRASRLTRKMIALSKGSPIVKETASISELVRETSEVVLSGSSVRVVFSISESCSSCDVDKTQIEQVISNLVTNSKQAMDGGGHLHVSMDEVDVGHASNLPLKRGSYLRISIRDEGPGIPPEVLPKIFEPYFTTKGAKGTGLGLATSFNIVKNHGGHLAVESKPGRGTTFHIYLPASTRQARAESRAGNSVVPGQGRILVMDDEDIIRTLAVKVLGNLGYGCDCAENGEDAIKMFMRARQSGNPYSAVILDLTVKAGMGGLETLEVLRELDPEIKAIASSGYSEVAPDVLAEQGFQDTLPKPYSISALSKKLHLLLGGS